MTVGVIQWCDGKGKLLVAVVEITFKEYVA
jgi:hypothetical protein